MGPSFAQLLLECSFRVMGGNLKPCWLHREAWGGGRGVQNVNFFKKKVGSQGRKGDRPRLSGFFLVVCPALML